MSNYSISTHHLVFSSSYDSVSVMNGSSTVETFDLSIGDPLNIKISNNEFVLTEASQTLAHSAIYKTDITSGTVTEFDGLILIGVDIVDLRDTGRVRRSDKYHMSDQTVVLEYITGNPAPLKIGIKFDPPSGSTEDTLIQEFK